MKRTAKKRTINFYCTATDANDSEWMEEMNIDVEISGRINVESLFHTMADALKKNASKHVTGKVVGTKVCVGFDE